MLQNLLRFFPYFGSLHVTFSILGEFCNSFNYSSLFRTRETNWMCRKVRYFSQRICSRCPQVTRPMLFVVSRGSKSYISNFMWWISLQISSNWSNIVKRSPATCHTDAVPVPRWTGTRCCVRQENDFIREQPPHSPCHSRLQPLYQPIFLPLFK